MPDVPMNLDVFYGQLRKVRREILDGRDVSDVELYPDAEAAGRINILAYDEGSNTTYAVAGIKEEAGSMIIQIAEVVAEEVPA